MATGPLTYLAYTNIPTWPTIQVMSSSKKTHEGNEEKVTKDVRQTRDHYRTRLITNL